MSQEARVDFKETGSAQVVGAFKNVGSAAAQSAQQVNQNSSAIGSLGKGMKSSVASIGQVATAFATLSLSIVNTYRSYRDLTDAQIQVDAATKKLHSTELAISTLQKQIAAERKVGAKGGLDYAIAQNKITQAEQDLAKHRKDGKHTAAQLKGEELALTKAKQDAGKGSAKLTDLEAKLGLAQEQLGVQTQRVSEAHEHFNDVQQNFYLSLLPTAISSIATLTTGFSGLKGVLSGGGGLVGTLGPIGIGLTAISVGFLAWKNNLFGIQDAVKNFIPVLKQWATDAKNTIQTAFDQLRKGDWQGAFNTIRSGIEKWWHNVMITVPFFGNIDRIIAKIRAGDWGGAFAAIQTAANQFWTWLKTNVPFFAGVEMFINKIKAGDWKGAFAVVAEGAKEVSNALFGPNFTSRLQLMGTTAKAKFNELAHDLSAKGGAFDLINQGLANIGKGNIGQGFGQIATGIKTGLGLATNTINAWVLTNFGIDLAKVSAQANAIGNSILNGIKGGLTFIARTWIDPFIASLFKIDTWTSALTAAFGAITAAGNAVFTFIAGAISGAAADPKGAATFWNNIGSAIWKGISDWFTTNLPDTTAILSAIGQSMADAASKGGIWFQNVGRAIWNQIVEGLKAVAGTNVLGSALAGQLDKLKLPMLDIKPTITPKVNTAPATTAVNKIKTSVNSIPKTHQTNVTTPGASQSIILANKVKQAINNIPNKKVVTITVKANLGAAAGFNAGVHIRGGQHGGSEIVNRPTLFMAGEQNTKERVTVEPMSGDGGGGGDVYVGPIYLDGEKVQDTMRLKMNRFQGTFK